MRLVEAIGDRRTARTPFVPLGIEHEVVDEQLRAAAEQIDERGSAMFRVEHVVLVESHPRQLPPLPGQVIVPSGQFLLGIEQLEPGFEPLLARPDPVVRHPVSPSDATRTDVGMADRA